MPVNTKHTLSVLVRVCVCAGICWYVNTNDKDTKTKQNKTRKHDQSRPKPSGPEEKSDPHLQMGEKVIYTTTKNTENRK